VTRRALLRAALTYVQAGWPIVPGATPYGSSRRRTTVQCAARPVPVACSCGRAECWSPAAHPRDHDWLHQVITDPADVRFWWGSDAVTVPNIVLVCGDTFDTWSVPHAVGSRALDLLPDDIAPFVPISMTPTERWHLFTAPVMPDETPHVPSGRDVLHLGAGQFVPAPPSTRGALGHDTWLAEQRRHRLPPWPPIAAALTKAAEQLHHRELTRPRAATRRTKPGRWRASNPTDHSAW
jgi:hypothetical protein